MGRDDNEEKASGNRVKIKSGARRTATRYDTLGAKATRVMVERLSPKKTYRTKMILSGMDWLYAVGGLFSDWLFIMFNSSCKILC